MSTFLQLAQDLRRNCLIPGTGPAATQNQSGQAERMVKFIRDAYTELQNEQPNWRWMRGNFQLNTVANVRQYAYNATGLAGTVIDSDTAAAIPTDRFRRWWIEEGDTMIYRLADGVATRHTIPFNDWTAHRRTWYLGQQNAGYPSELSIDPQDRIRLGATPDGVFVVEGEYQKGPQILVVETDVPEMPPRHHDMIVAMAMKKYAASMAAPEVYAQAQDVERQHRSALETDQLPVPKFGAPLC